MGNFKKKFNLPQIFYKYPNSSWLLILPKILKKSMPNLLTMDISPVVTNQMPLMPMSYLLLEKKLDIFQTMMKPQIFSLMSVSSLTSLMKLLLDSNLLLVENKKQKEEKEKKKNQQKKLMMISIHLPLMKMVK